VKINNHRDFFSGLLFLGIGVAFAWGASTYKIGVADRMGPGYFPLILGVLMSVLGIFIILKSLALKTGEGDRVGAWAWKPLVYILAANVAFGVLLAGLPSIKLPATGLIAAIYALTVIASLAGRQFKLTHTLVLATVLAAISYCAFIALLKLQIPVWPVFITG
jgi:hypothetical protein